MSEKLKATLDCIKDSETILCGEYYVIHSDYIIALEEEIKKLDIKINMETKIDGKKVLKILDKALGSDSNEQSNNNRKE